MDQPARVPVPVSQRLLYRPPQGGWWSGLWRALGPGYLVAVGYIDPGNWATDLAGGSAAGYGLLWVVVLANVMAMVLQGLALRLGIVTGMDLATACRHRYPRRLRLALWLLAEAGIVATDLAEVIGSAIALRLLFHLPLVVGVGLTVVDVLLVLALTRWGLRPLEAVVVALIAIVAGCFVLELMLAHPALPAVAAGLVPHPGQLRDPTLLVIAVGIVGATVMPHNLFLHGALVTPPADSSPAARRVAVRWASFDSLLALTLALGINAAILVLAGAAFHAHGRTDVADLAQACGLLAPLLGLSIAGVVFAVGLLASGVNASLTATLAGQVVMEGFLAVRVRPWVRRLVTRLLAIIPAAVVVLLAGEHGIDRLLLLSQVVLALVLPCAALPLVHLCADRSLLGGFALSGWGRVGAWVVAGASVALALVAVVQTVVPARLAF